MKRIQRKDKRWLQAVGSIDQCVLCGSRDGLQVAHNWENKGMGMKAPDYETARLCADCHFELDNGKLFNRVEKRQKLSQAIVRTHSILIEEGLLDLESC